MSVLSLLIDDAVRRTGPGLEIGRVILGVLWLKCLSMNFVVFCNAERRNSATSPTTPPPTTTTTTTARRPSATPAKLPNERTASVDTVRAARQDHCGFFRPDAHSFFVPKAADAAISAAMAEIERRKQLAAEKREQRKRELDALLAAPTPAQTSRPVSTS